MPLRQFIEHLYFKSFGKERPDVVLSIEEHVRRIHEKKARKREARLQRRQNAAGNPANAPASDAPGLETPQRAEDTE